MKISEYGIDVLQKVSKQSTEGVPSKKIKASIETSKINNGDRVRISEEARELEKSNDEISVVKKLLATLPTARAHVIYEAIAKVKAGSYASDEIVVQAAEKLIKSGELDDLGNRMVER